MQRHSARREWLQGQLEELHLSQGKDISSKDLWTVRKLSGGHDGHGYLTAWHSFLPLGSRAPLSKGTILCGSTVGAAHILKDGHRTQVLPIQVPYLGVRCGSSCL